MKIRCGWFATAAVSGALVVVAAMLSGCGGDSTTGVTNAAAANENTNFNDTNSRAPQAPPTLQELVTRLNLTTEQSTVVGAALKRWQDALDSHRAAGRDGQGRGERRRGGRGRGGPGGGMGPGGPGGGMGSGGPGGPGGGMGPGGPGPIIGFLGDVSAAISPEQFASLVQFLIERRPAAPDSIGGRPPVPPQAFRKFAKENNLNDTQKLELRNAFRTAARALGDLRKGIVEGAITGDAIRSQAAAIRDQLAQSARTTLGDEIYAKFVALLGEMRTRMTGKMLEQAGSHIDRRVETLAKLLGLTDEQKVQVRAALEASVPEMKALLTGINDGTVPFEDAVYRAWQIGTTTDAAIRAVLTPDQLTRYNALREMMAERPFVRLYL